MIMRFFIPSKKQKINTKIREQLIKLTKQMDKWNLQHKSISFEGNYKCRVNTRFSEDFCERDYATATMLSQKYHFLKEVSELWNTGELTGVNIQSLLKIYPLAYKGVFSATKSIINLLNEDVLVSKDINLVGRDLSISEHKSMLTDGCPACKRREEMRKNAYSFGK